MSKSVKSKVRKQYSDKEQNASGRLGCMQGEFSVPDDIDQIEKDKISHLFKAAIISTNGHRFNRKDANKR